MELVVFVALVVAIGGIGVRIGILLAPHLTALAERAEDADATGDGSAMSDDSAGHDGSGAGDEPPDEPEDEAAR